jgi:hypothetical protein
MNDKKSEDYTINEKLDLLMSIVGDMNLYFMNKYPDYLEDVMRIREKFSEELLDKMHSESKEKAV